MTFIGKECLILRKERNEVNLREMTGITSGIEVCYLVEDSKRITSETFKVHIPSLMGGIDNTGKEPEDVNIDTSKVCLNAENPFNKKVNSGFYIEALNFTPYGHRLDGWIPKFRIQKLTAESGNISTQNASSISGVTDPGGPGPHTHTLSQPLTLSDNSLSEIVFNNLVATSSTEVDFQELNKKFIKRGAMMIGTFINGLQNTFVILAIQNAVPRLTQTEPTGDGDNPDTSIDGGNNPSN